MSSYRRKVERNRWKKKDRRGWIEKILDKTCLKKYKKYRGEKSRKINIWED